MQTVKIFIMVIILGSGFNSLAQRLIVKVKPAVPGHGIVISHTGGSHNKVWIQGQWFPNGNGYVWRNGYYTHCRPGFTYIDGHWRRHAGGWIWIPGRWRRVR